jgi:sodium-dependent dicarboxylate transporter 2/3/5
VALLLILWLYLSFGISHKTEKINQKKLKLKYESLVKFSNKEKVSLFILILAALLWIFKIKINNFLDINLNDSGIALFSAILFFILPVNKKMDVILDFDWFKNIPWNVLILFGGGLSMASLVMETGLANELSKNIVFLNQLSLLLIIFTLTFLTSLFTEFTSNTATTFLLLPLLGTFAINSDINVVTVILPVVLAASCAFMMPISTPPNAIVFSTNQINISFMIKTGLVMNIISILMISLYVYIFGLSFF